MCEGARYEWMEGARYPLRADSRYAAGSGGIMSVLTESLTGLAPPLLSMPSRYRRTVKWVSETAGNACREYYLFHSVLHATKMVNDATQK